MGAIVNQLLPHILTAFGYAALGFHFWDTRWRGRQRGGSPGHMLFAERLAIGVVLGLHAVNLAQAIFTGSTMRFSFAQALSLIFWLAVLIYWLESFRARMDGLQPLVLPLAALAATLPLIFSQTHEIAHTGAVFRFHFVAAMLAYSLFTLAMLHAIFMHLTETALRRHALSPRLASLPPLLAMERLLFHMILAGFALLTLTLVSGLFFSESVSGQALALNHMTVFAFLSWLIFAILLAGRRWRGWRGKKAMYWTLAGFMALLLAYIGSRFILEILLHRP